MNRQSYRAPISQKRDVGWSTGRDHIGDGTACKVGFSASCVVPIKLAHYRFLKSALAYRRIGRSDSEAALNAHPKA
jgi:hypothetical protein